MSKRKKAKQKLAATLKNLGKKAAKDLGLKPAKIQVRY
jgi:hypothetical protein